MAKRKTKSTPKLNETDELSTEVEQDFAERQRLAKEGRKVLRRKLNEHNAKSPEISAGDVDAAWDRADVGEETVGGSVPTPDQDNVDDIGEAAGLTYEDDEPLDYGKVSERDENRWELNPASVENDITWVDDETEEAELPDEWEDEDEG
jgi:hypothetical protein